MPEPWGLEVDIFFVTKFHFTEIQIFASIHLNTWKYNVCSIQLETKVVRLHTIQVLKISVFLVNKYAVHDFDCYL